MANSATFMIRRVVAKDEMGTGWTEWMGQDEIHGAVFGGDLLGNPASSGEFGIGDFNDGTTKRFNPPKAVLTVDLAGATGELELSFSAILIESQIFKTDVLEKVYQEFSKAYKEAAKEELAKRDLTPERAQTVAQPGYLAPRPDGGATDERYQPEDTMGGRVPTIGTNSGETVTVADEDDLIDPFPDDDKKKEEEKHLVRDAFLTALAAAAAALVITTGGSVIKLLIGATSDKYFPAVAIKAKVDASAGPDTPPPSAAGTAEFVGHNGNYQVDWEVVLN